MPLLTNNSKRIGKVPNVIDRPFSEAGKINAVDEVKSNQDAITALQNYYKSNIKPFVTTEAGVGEYAVQSSALEDSVEPKRQVTRTTPTQISIQHVATGKVVFFPAFLKTYSETFAPSYSSEDVFGRMDPLMSFQKTSRTIALGWAVPAYSQQESELNLSRLSSLAQFMYPTYRDKGDATLIAKPPLLRIRFANLIQNANQPSVGLLCAATNFSFNPNIEMGFFTVLGEKEAGPSGTAMGLGGALYPKSVDCTLALTVLHEHDVGHSEILNSSTPESPDSVWLGNTKGSAEYPWGRPGVEAFGGNTSSALITLVNNGSLLFTEVSTTIPEVEVPMGSDTTPKP
jgi:hypothetical protein